jgi:hypothetical protein
MGRHARLHRAYGLYMNNELAAAEAEVRALLAEGGDESDPLKPAALCHVLSAAVAQQPGRMEEGVQLMREGDDCARRRGPDYDYDLAEALHNRCSFALFAGTTDRAAANEYLQLAQDLGNARALAGALLMSGMFDPDPRRGAELLAQARELTARTRDTFRYLLATLWLGYLADDSTVAIRALPSMVEQARSTGQRLILAQQGRVILSQLADLGRYDAVAVLDGASTPTSLRPVLAAEAVTAARATLGEDHYAELYDMGRSFTPADLEGYLLQLASDVS